MELLTPVPFYAVHWTDLMSALASRVAVWSACIDDMLSEGSSLVNPQHSHASLVHCRRCTERVPHHSGPGNTIMKHSGSGRSALMFQGRAVARAILRVILTQGQQVALQ
jgi:hypothetical protein